MYFFKRPTVFLMARNPRLVRCKGFGLEARRGRRGPPGDARARRECGHETCTTRSTTYRGHTVPHFRIIERRNVWFAFSGVLIVLSLVGLVASGLNYSIDFDGGAKLQLPVVAPMSRCDDVAGGARRRRP